MRIAVFSDVHGNRFALEAVLRDIEATQPDLLLNLGDQVWGAADPAGAFRLQQESGAVTVRGNTDEFLSFPRAKLGDSAELADWLQAQLEPSVPTRLMNFPAVAVVAEGAVVVSHGFLDNPSDALMVTHEAGKTWPVPPEILLERTVAYPDTQVFVVGHTHTEMVVSCSGKTFVNVGSVSRQFNGDPLARWVLLEKRSRAWSLAFQRVPYDTEAAARWALQHSPIGEREAYILRNGLLP